MKSKNIVISILGVVFVAGAAVVVFISSNNAPTNSNFSLQNSAKEFPSGIYYRSPNLSSPEAMLYKMTDPLDFQAIEDVGIQMSPVGFDILKNSVVFVSGTDLVVVSPDKKSRRVAVKGLGEMARPSFSPDGTQAVVQAKSGGGDLDIYVVNLQSGESEKISSLPVNEESPEWFPNKNWVVYSSFSPEDGVNMHIYDLDGRREVREVKDAGAIHLSVSQDGMKILDPGRFRIYDAEGNLLADHKDKVLRQLSATMGIVPDDRFPGQANRGTLPLDGDFSPTGDLIVFDGAVKSKGEYRTMLFVTDLDGNILSTVSPPIQTNPEFSNNHNFSQINPRWLE